MIPTISFLQNKFDEFNAWFFSNELPPIVISLCRSKRTYGKFKYVRNAVKKEIPIRIEISKYFDLPQKNIEEVLIHEMIHYYCCIKNWRTKDPHGYHFLLVAGRINNMSNYHITTFYEGEKGAINRSYKKTYYYVTYEYCNNKYFSRISKNMAYSYMGNNMYGVFKKVKNVEVFTTSDESLDKYEQKSSKLSLFPIIELGIIKSKRIA